MYASELDPQFKAIFTNVVHVYGVFVLIFNLAICIITIADNDTRATTYRYYLASLQAPSMLMDLIIHSYMPIYQINCSYSQSRYLQGVFLFGEMATSYFYCVFYRRCLVLRRGSRFCLFGWRRFALFYGLQAYMWSMCAVFAAAATSVRTPTEEIPSSLAWLHKTPSFIIIRATNFVAAAALYVLGWVFAVYIVVVWMIVDLQRELRHGMTHASRTTRRIQKKALTALKLQGIIPGVLSLIPILGLVAIYGYGMIVASMLSAILFTSLSIHTLAHSLTILACSPTYRKTIRVEGMFRWLILLMFVADFAFADRANNSRRRHRKRTPIVDADVPSPPIECGAHSHATSCAVCDATCFDPVPRPCPNFCVHGPPTRCECDAGYLRHGTRCVKPAICPKPCRPNQEWSRCPTSCEPTCHDPYPICAFGTTCGSAAKAKCQCKPGFYRQSSAADAICVPWWQCRRHGGPTPRPPLRRAPGGKARPWNWWGTKPM